MVPAFLRLAAAAWRPTRTTPSTATRRMEHLPLPLRRNRSSRALDVAMSAAERVPTDIAGLIVSPKAYAAQKELMAGFRWLRHNNPIGRVEAAGFDPFWAVTRHADIVAVSRRHELFHNGVRASTLVPRAADELARSLRGGSPHLMRTLLQMDAPDHARYRQITQAWFTQKNLDSFEDRIRRVARLTIDRMAAHGESCDFVRDVALHYPLQVIMDILGLPEEDEPMLLKLTQELFRSQDEGPV